MVCPECRAEDHGNCYDTKHPNQTYRGCACQHQPRGEEGESLETMDQGALRSRFDVGRG